MKCECPYTLKVPLGNAFQVLFPVKTAEWKDGEREVEVADVHALTDIVVKVDGEAQNQGTAKAGEYFSQARLSRQQARDEAVSILTKTAESETATQEARTAASTGIQVMADNAVVESRIENLVIAKGYADCVAFINDNGVNVIVSKTENGLTDTDVARIRDIVISEANVTADAIKIIETE